MSINIEEMQQSHRLYVGEGRTMVNKIALALNGYDLDRDYESTLKTDDGSLKSTIEASEFRKLKWSMKAGLRYALVYSYKDEEDFFNGLRSEYGNTIRWISKMRKFTTDKVVINYTTDIIEYREVTTVDSLNFFLIPIHLWNGAIKEWEESHE